MKTLHQWQFEFHQIYITLGKTELRQKLTFMNVVVLQGEQGLLCSSPGRNHVVDWSAAVRVRFCPCGEKVR